MSSPRHPQTDRSAKNQLRRLGHETVAVGVNTTSLFALASGFLDQLASLGGKSFVESLDYWWASRAR